MALSLVNATGLVERELYQRLAVASESQSGRAV